MGEYEIVRTKNKKIPKIIYAPTMRVPMALPSDSVNPYLAMKAILKAKMLYADLGTISISGLGTGIGNIPYNICAHQMRQAYDDVFLSAAKFPESWAQAQLNHQALYTNEFRNIQNHTRK